MLGHPAAWTWVHSSLVSASSSHTSHNYALYSVYHFRKFFTLVHIITVVIIMLLYYNMYVDLHTFCCFHFHSICHFHFQKPSVPSSNRVMPASSLPLDASGAQMLWVTCAVMTQNGLLSCIMCERTANTNLPTYTEWTAELYNVWTYSKYKSIYTEWTANLYHVWTYWNA